MSWKGNGCNTPEPLCFDEDVTCDDCTSEETICIEGENCEYQVPEKRGDNETIRVALFNVLMQAQKYESDFNVVISEGSNILMEQLISGENEHIKQIAEIIQRVRPDVILLNEFDYIMDENMGINAFVELYLNEPQSEGLDAIDYPYHFVSTSNTGVKNSI
eukprot:UN33224